MPVPNPPGAGVALPSARIERLPRITRDHRVWTAVLSLMFLCDIIDIYSLSYAAPAVRAAWNLSITEVGALTSYTFLGMFVGALVGGRLSDRFGRRRTLSAAAIGYGLCSLLCAVAPGYLLLGVFRFLTGAGLQAATGVLLVYVVEMFPAASRGRYLSFMIGTGSVGVPLIALVARAVVPLGPDAWRWVFVIGGIGLLPGVLVALLLPESVHWLELHGRHEQAAALVQRLETAVEARTGRPLPPAEVRLAQPRYGPGRLTQPPYGRRTAVTCVTMLLAVLGFYGFNNWVPTMLVERGFTAATALSITAILAVAPVVGALAALPITDRWQRRRISLVLCALIAAAMVVFAFTRSLPQLVIAGFVATFLLQTNTAVMYAYLPEVFPTAVRGVGSGLANGVGRLAGVASGFVIAAIAGVLGFAGVFVTTALFILLAGLVVGLFGEDTRNRRLTDIAGAEKDTGSGPVPELAGP